MDPLARAVSTRLMHMQKLPGRRRNGGHASTGNELVRNMLMQPVSHLAKFIGRFRALSNGNTCKAVAGLMATGMKKEPGPVLPHVYEARCVE